MEMQKLLRDVNNTNASHQAFQNKGTLEAYTNAQNALREAIAKLEEEAEAFHLLDGFLFDKRVQIHYSCEGCQIHLVNHFGDHKMLADETTLIEAARTAIVAQNAPLEAFVSIFGLPGQESKEGTGE